MIKNKEGEKIKEDLYEKYNVPGRGQVLGDGTYWNFISEKGANLLRSRGMKDSTGKTCLAIKNIEDKIIAQWQS